MYKESLSLTDTIIIFFPFRFKNIQRCYVFGDFSVFDNYVKILFITKLFDANNKTCMSLFNKTDWDGNEFKLKLLNNWIYFEVHNNVLSVKELKIGGKFREFDAYRTIWINYDFKYFSQCEIIPSEIYGAYCDKSYFKFFMDKVKEKQKKTRSYSLFKIVLLSFLSTVILRLPNYSVGQLQVAKYFNVILHIDNYLSGFVWAMKTLCQKEKLDIKVINFLMSVFLDMFLGVLFLNWLNSKISLDSFPDLFLLASESVVNSIKELINWLSGHPGGLKLNWAFSKILATFFLFHIDIWWTFLTNIKPLVKIIFQVFLKLGLLGITFQASITADLLALVSFHVYCIYAYAAKLYNFQISSLVSLWRLFFGRKKNPLRQKVDSCRYSPEQLFIGTLGFTISLFLLPTTLLYYVVFTWIRLCILTMQAVLMLIRHLNQSLPVYSTILWLIKSPKISVGIELEPHKDFIKSNLLLMDVKPAAYSWWETVNFYVPDCAPKPGGFNASELLNSIILLWLQSSPWIWPQTRRGRPFAVFWTCPFLKQNT